MMLKAPKMERQHLLALKTLIRLTYARAVRFKVEQLQKASEHPAETTLKLLKLADILNDNDQPLTVTLAMMDMHGAPLVFMPVTDARFDFYQQTLATDITVEDFRGMAVDQVTALLEPLKQFQVELRKIFAEAMTIDPQEIRRAAASGKTPAMKPGLAN